MGSKVAIHKITIPTPFSVGDVNVYLVEGDALTLVDAGPKTSEAWNMLKKRLKELGFVPADLDQIVLTHHHPDHIGLLDFFDKDLPVLGHRLNTPWLCRDVAFFKRQSEFFLTLAKQLGVPEKFAEKMANFDLSIYSCTHPLTTAIKEGDKVDGLPGFTVMETPGHAQSHIVLYNEKNGRMIGGDHLIKTISSNPLLEMPDKGKERPRPQLQYNKSLKRLLDMPISVVYPGHREEIFEPHRLIRHRLERQHERAINVWHLLKMKKMTAFALCKLLFPSAYEREFLFAISETVAQLDYLENLGKVNKQLEDGVWIFSTNDEEVKK